MKHPPIPPNCHFFIAPYVTPEGLNCSWAFDTQVGQLVYLTPCDVATLWNPPNDVWARLLERFRPIIAAVARCAWLDEAERRKREYEAEPYTGDTMSSKELHLMLEVEKAGRTAAAWAEWGKGTQEERK